MLHASHDGKDDALGDEESGRDDRGRKERAGKVLEVRQVQARECLPVKFNKLSTLPLIVILFLHTRAMNSFAPISKPTFIQSFYSAPARMKSTAA